MTSDDAPGGARRGRRPVADEVLDALRRMGRPATAAEVAADAGLDERTASRALGRLVADRDARRAGGGRYTAARRPR